MATPLVSIVIPTCNSEATIPICLESIVKQTYKNIEVIIVDKFSKDRTTEIAKNMGVKVIQAIEERSKAKNIGLRNSRGKYILFIDSDMELSSTVIEQCIELAESNLKIGGIVIPEISVGNSYWAKVRSFERSFYAETPIESARFFRKDVALLVGGFDEDIVFYEEATLSHKIEELGHNVRARINSHIIHHEERFSLRKWLKKKYYYGKTVKVYINRYKNKCKYINMQVSPIQRFKMFFLSKKFWGKPHLAIGVLMLKAMESLMACLGYITTMRPLT